MFNLTEILIGVPVTLIALTVHEYAHGYVSSKLGDPTPRYEGRLTLNPMAHLDLVGTILMVLTGFGWAKPVPINPMYYKDRVKGMSLVALAGPLSNFLLAVIGAFLAVLSHVIEFKTGFGMGIASYVMSVFVISEKCGFSSSSNFYKAFFNITGTKPSDYKPRLQQK